MSNETTKNELKKIKCKQKICSSKGSTIDAEIRNAINLLLVKINTEYRLSVGRKKLKNGN